MLLDVLVLQWFSLLLKTGDCKKLAKNNREVCLTTGCFYCAQVTLVTSLVTI